MTGFTSIRINQMLEKTKYKDQSLHDQHECLPGNRWAKLGIWFKPGEISPFSFNQILKGACGKVNAFPQPFK